MAGLGALIRTIRGITEGQKLTRQKDELGQMAEDDVLSLVPEPFRPCAELRLRVAQSDIAVTEVHEQLESAIVRSFEDIRKAGLNKMMEQASGEPVTRDEMVRLIHTLDEYARSANADIEALDKETKQILDSTQERLSQHDVSFASFQQQLDEHSNILTALRGLSAKVDSVESQFTSASEKLQMSVRRLRLWMIAIGGLSIVECACIIYLLLR